MEKQPLNRRDFVKNAAMASVGGIFMPLLSMAQLPAKNLNHIGPQQGFTPHIGTLISMLDWLSNSVIQYHKGLSVAQLDYIFDAESNSIGALMMHLAATEVIYQDLTFHNLEDFSKENESKWKVAMDLGKDAQQKIKGNNIDYYKNMFEEVRATTKAEMKKRDDKWLLSGETKDWDWNNYCKWFHVAEHYANHRGQMTWYAKRAPK